MGLCAALCYTDLPASSEILEQQCTDVTVCFTKKNCSQRLERQTELALMQGDELATAEEAVVLTGQTYHRRGFTSGVALYSVVLL